MRCLSKISAYEVGHHASVYPNLEYFPDRPAEVKKMHTVLVKK